MSSIFAGAVSAYLDGRRPTPRMLGDAAVHGYTIAFWVAAGIFAIRAGLVGALMRAGGVRPEHVAEPAHQALAA